MSQLDDLDRVYDHARDATEALERGDAATAKPALVDLIASIDRLGAASGPDPTLVEAVEVAQRIRGAAATCASELEVTGQTDSSDLRHLVDDLEAALDSVRGAPGRDG